jgi:thiamine pyrophosphate-dependent acetolactate synthase large subunit-like protein
MWVSPSSVQTGAQAAFRALEDNGVDVVFGIPGTHTLSLYREFACSRIRHITPRHEQGGGYAADGYARASGRAGVCLVITGPGVLNAATPAATAYADSIPQLIISTGLPREIEGTDAGYLHQTKNQHGALDAVTAWSHRASSPADVATAIHDAFALFGTGRPRPVHVEIPLDVLDRPARIDRAARRGELTSPAPPPEALSEAVQLLAAATRPALVLGGGAREAHIEATALAERLQAPVLTTVNGKAVVSEFHPLSLGASIRLPRAQKWLAQRDLVVAVGTELGESDLWGPPLSLAGKVIRIDIDPGQLDKNLRADVALHGRARPTLRALLDALPKRGSEDPRSDHRLDALRDDLTRDAIAEGKPWVELSTAIQGAVADDGIICGDSTMACYFGVVHFTKLGSPSRFLYPTGYATLGYALPAAIGAKVAHPDLRVVALVGDGGLMFTVAELITASEHQLGLPIVVVNNRGHGEIRRRMLLEGIAPVGVDLTTPDFPLLARSLGAEGRRVERPAELEHALHEAFERHHPTLIEVRRDPIES